MQQHSGKNRSIYVSSISYPIMRSNQNTTNTEFILRNMPKDTNSWSHCNLGAGTNKLLRGERLFVGLLLDLIVGVEGNYYGPPVVGDPGTSITDAPTSAGSTTGWSPTTSFFQKSSNAGSPERSSSLRLTAANCLTWPFHALCAEQCPRRWQLALRIGF